ncbi:MAG: hypothetical protein KGM42_18795 [Hyphomicrobiales bacterium]|nr:hypothetical protein [Hyphomicrobiales bacterium]
MSRSPVEFDPRFRRIGGAKAARGARSSGRQAVLLLVYAALAGSAVALYFVLVR